MDIRIIGVGHRVGPPSQVVEARMSDQHLLATFHEAHAAAAGDGGAAPLVSPASSGPEPRPPLVRPRPPTRTSARSTRLHRSPCRLVRSLPPRTPRGTARGWPTRALLGSLHPFLFPSLSLLARAFFLSLSLRPLIGYCFFSPSF